MPGSSYENKVTFYTDWESALRQEFYSHFLPDLVVLWGQAETNGLYDPTSSYRISRQTRRAGDFWLVCLLPLWKSSWATPQGGLQIPVNQTPEASESAIERGTIQWCGGSETQPRLCHCLCLHLMAPWETAGSAALSLILSDSSTSEGGLSQSQQRR